MKTLAMLVELRPNGLTAYCQKLYIAAENASRQDERIFVGIDGLPTPDGGIQEVINGNLAVTYVYPTGGAEAIASVYEILVEGKTVLEKRNSHAGGLLCPCVIGIR